MNDTMARLTKAQRSIVNQRAADLAMSLAGVEPEDVARHLLREAAR